MITGDLRNRIDSVWDAFWSGGISNPLEVIQQITYLLFIRRLDDIATLQENRARRTGRPVEAPIFSGTQQAMRWHVFKDYDPDRMFVTVSNAVFPFLKRLGTQVGGDGSTYAEHLKDANFTIPTAGLLSKVVGMLDEVPLENRDTSGDLYEYLLSRLSSAGVNGQFRTPRHIIKLMVEMTDPGPDDVICDPACGMAGFLVAASEHVREAHPESQTNADYRTHFHHGMFHGFDFDSTMLRIGSMNMLLHGIESPDIRYRDSLSQGAAGDSGQYSLILANPPFAGSLDYETTAKDLLAMARTKKTELLFLALFLRLLEHQELDAVVKLPSGVFKPYAGVSTAILFFTKTDSGGTDDVWFYDVRADGFSLDDKRNPVDANDLPDVLERWQHRDAEKERKRTEQSFMVPKAEIVEQGYDLSLNRYKEIEYDEVEHRPPLEIIADIEKLDAEIADGVAELKAMLG